MGRLLSIVKELYHEKKKLTKSGQPLLLTCIVEFCPRLWSMAYIKYVKLSQINGISNGTKRILIAIPIVMIADKTTIGFPMIGFLIYFKFIYSWFSDPT